MESSGPLPVKIESSGNSNSILLASASSVDGFENGSLTIGTSAGASGVTSFFSSTSGAG